MRVRVSQLVKAPRERVFAAYVDLESMPKWSASAGKVRVIRRDSNAVTFVAEAQGRMGPRTVSGELLLTPPGMVRTGSESPRSRTKGTVTFESVAEGTLVTSTIEVELKGFRRYFFRPALGESSREAAERNLAAFARYVEGLGSGPGQGDDGSPLSEP